MIKSSAQILLLFSSLLFLSACGATTSLTGSQSFVVEMYGVFEEPVGADGAFEPKWQNYLLTDVLITKSDGSGDVDLMTSDPPVVRIVDRTQIIFSADVAEYEGVAMSGLTIKFDPSIVVAGKAAEHTVILDTGDMTLAQSISVGKGQGITVLLKVKWKNTIKVDEATGEESALAPTFDISIK